MEKAKGRGAPHFSGSRQHSQALSPRGTNSGFREACTGAKGIRAESDFPFGSPLQGYSGCEGGGAWETGKEEREGVAWTRPTADRRNGQIFRIQNGQDSLTGGQRG